MSAFRDGLFDGQVALVTGGGTGIGFATARELGSLGARIVIASRTEAHFLPAAERLREHVAEVEAFPLDIRDLDSVEALMKSIRERFGRLDILVNNAGGQFPTPALNLKPKGWDAVIRNNLNGTFYITQAAAKHFFVPDAGGAIVNVIANIERGFPGMAHTGAARAGVENLTRSLSIEWVTHGIRVNAVAPGVIFSEGIAQYPESLIGEARKHIPMKRFGTVEEVASLVTYLASPAASYVTGETVYVDGGARLWGSAWHIPEPAAD